MYLSHVVTYLLRARDALRRRFQGLAYFPQGVVHTYKNVGKAPGRMLVVNTRAGLERFVEEVGQPATDASSPPTLAGPPDFGKMIETARKYDIEIIGPVILKLYKDQEKCVE